MVIQKVRKAVAGLGTEWKNKSRRMTIHNEFRQFRKVFKENFITLIISAFGVVAALSWNEAIKEAVLGLFPTQGPLVSKVFSALAITVISIFVTYLLSKMKTQN